MKISRVTCVLTLFVVPLAAPALAAQMPSAVHFEPWRPGPPTAMVRVWTIDSAAPKANGSGMILGGITGFVVGYSIGGLVGGALSQGGDDDLAALVYGGAVVSSLTIPLGVHLGNHGQGNLTSDLLLSGAIGALGIGIGAATNDATPFLLTSLAQVISSIWMEERTMRRAPPPDASH